MIDKEVAKAIRAEARAKRLDRIREKALAEVNAPKSRKPWAKVRIEAAAAQRPKGRHVYA